jgi:hypothetical protein
MSRPAAGLAHERIERFVRRFGAAYRRLAWHAALPLILTPELLGYLRQRFLSGRDGVPWIGVADLLLSDLCRPVGYEQFALDQDVRVLLIAEMRAALDQETLRETACLLLNYLGQLDPRAAGLGADELQAEQWSAMVYLAEHRKEAAHQITVALGEGLTAVAAEAVPALPPNTELARLLRVTEQLAPQLAEHQELLDYAAEIAHLLRDVGAWRATRERLAADPGRLKARRVEGVSVPALAAPSQIGRWDHAAPATNHSVTPRRHPHIHRLLRAHFMHLDHATLVP